MRTSQSFSPMLPGDGHSDTAVIHIAAPASVAVPIPQRWLASIPSLHTNGDDSELVHASQQYVDHPARFRDIGNVVGQHPAQRSSKRNEVCGCNGSGANTVANHDVGQNPSMEHQGIHLAAGDDWRTDKCLADPNDMIPIVPTDRSAPVNTLLVSNVSRRLSQEDVLRYWPRITYNYDLLYLAFEARKRRGSGWLFINFGSHEEAAEFRDMWHDQVHPMISRAERTGNRRPLHIGTAKLQGLEPNLAHWQRTLRRHVGASFAPAVFVGGQRVDFWQYVDKHNVPLVLSV